MEAGRHTGRESSGVYTIGQSRTKLEVEARKQVFVWYSRTGAG